MPEYQRAEVLIAERVATDAIYQPDAEAVSAERTAALLEKGLTVDAAVQVALLNNPQFQAQVAEIGASQADLVQSTLWTKPTLALALQLPEGGGLANVSGGFAAQIADFWQIPVRQRRAEADLERTITMVGQRAVELVAQVRTAAYRVLALQQAVEFTEQDVELLRRAVALSDAQFRAGEVSEFDVNLAGARALDVEEELIRTRAALEQARADLAQLLGVGAAGAAISLADDLPRTSSTALDEAELLTRALAERFDLRMAEFAVDRADAELELQCRRFLPDVQVGFAFQRTERRALPDRDVLADTARASVAAGQLAAPPIQSRGQRDQVESQLIEARIGPSIALTLPIFDQNQAQIAKARVRTLQARKEYTSRVETAVAEIRRALVVVRAAVEMVEFQERRALALTRAAVGGAEQRYQAGAENLLVLLETQDALVRRRRSYVNALRDYAVALAQLEAAVGGRAVTSHATSPPPASQPTMELMHE